jgi:hypothetical protein
MQRILFLLVLLLVVMMGVSGQEKSVTETDKLVVIWSSGDPDVALKVCFMYTHAAKRMKWFDEVMLVVWGPSAKLLNEDEKVQQKLLQMKADGVILKACVNCADQYGVSDNLRKMGIEVKGMGKELTQMLKDNWRQLNF